jgi:hypothetical protein
MAVHYRGILKSQAILRDFRVQQEGVEISMRIFIGPEFFAEVYECTRNLSTKRKSRQVLGRPHGVTDLCKESHLTSLR